MSLTVRGARAEIALLVLINAFVGGMVGLERTTLPLLAEQEFGIASAAAATSFIVTFGLSKALTNLAAGRLADRHGRRRVLVAGWLAGIPVPIALVLAPSWGWIVAANALLGINQGLCWSMTVNMKLDRADPARRGLVVGLNEAAGYLGVAVIAFATGLLAGRVGVRPALGLGLALAIVGLALSLLAREMPRAEHTASRAPARERWLAPLSFAGLATNLKDGALWGLLPILLVARGLDLPSVGAIVAAYPVAWGAAQLVFGPLSDRIGRRGLAGAGLAIQAGGVFALAWGPGMGGMLAASALVGIGTAMTYPTLLALVADLAAPERRATDLGVYRAWRDGGYAVGALGAGVVADAAGAPVALVAVAGVVLAGALALGIRSRRAA